MFGYGTNSNGKWLTRHCIRVNIKMACSNVAIKKCAREFELCASINQTIDIKNDIQEFVYFTRASCDGK